MKRLIEVVFNFVFIFSSYLMAYQNTIIVNIKKACLQKRGIEDFEIWSQNPNSLYIGRNMSHYIKGANASIWQNIYNSNEYGLEPCLVLYENHIRQTPHLWNQLHTLKGKELGCWCKPNQCHGDILIKLLAEKENSN